MQIKVKKLDPSAKLPTKAYLNDAGWDVYACLADKVVLKPKEVTKIPTRIAVQLKFEVNYPLQDGDPCSYFFKFFDRSSMGSKALTVLGGVIDEGYRNDLVVMLYNGTDKPYVVEHGDKIAQFVILPVIPAQIIESEELEESERGGKGFGSSGK
jgi:dUTP pyrophosphatase